MATEKIRIDYVVNKKQLDASNESLKETAKANDLVQKEVEETNKKFKKQDKQLSKTNKLFTGLGGQLTALGNRFQIAGKGAGDMAAGLFKTTAATNVTSKAMKVLKFALISTGIGAIVVLLGSLVAYFSKTQKGSDLMSKALAGLGAIVDVIVGKLAVFGEKLSKLFSDPKQALKDFGKLIKENLINRLVGLAELLPALGKAINQLFSGEFKAAAKTAFDAAAKVGLGVENISDKLEGAVDGMKDLVVEIQGAVEDSNEYEALLVKLRQKEIEVTAEVAKRRRIIQEQLIITRDMTKSFEEQKAALDLANKLELANERDLLGLAQQKLAIAEKDMANTPVELRTDAQLLAISQARADTETAIANSTAKQREILNRQVELENRRLAAVKAVEAEEAKILATKEKLIADSEKRINDKIAMGKAILFEEELIRLKEQGATRLEIQTAQLEEQKRLEKAAIETSIEDAEVKARLLAIIDAKYADATKEIDNTIKDNKEANLSDLLSMAGQAAKKGTDLGKAVALAQIAQDTGKAISGLTAASEGNPANAVTYGGAGVLQFITGLLRIGVNIASAKSVLAGPTKFEKGGRIGGNLHSGGGTMIEAERDEFVMSRNATSKYGFDLMNKINNLELNDLTLGGDGSSINIIDTKEIADQLKNMPQNIMNVDSEGFELHQRRGANMISQKIERYST